MLLPIEHFYRLLSDPDEGLQEQAWSVVRNLSEDDAGIDMVFRNIGADVLLNQLATSLGSKDEDVLLQVCTDDPG